MVLQCSCGMSGAKQNSNTGTLKLKLIAFAENSGTSAGRENGISEIPSGQA